MLDRERHRARVANLLQTFPVVAILGARQVGKTTLARDLAGQLPQQFTRFDLEDPDDLARLAEPKLALEGLDGTIIIDEVQRRPELFPVLRVLVDRPGSRTRFLVLGSARPDLLRQSSESLAGRIAYHELDGFALDEVGTDNADRLWLRGGFPPAFLAETDRESLEWRSGFARTFLERDLPALGIPIAGASMYRFWQMLAHYHGQVWNGAELGRAFGVTATTIRRYLDYLDGTLVVRVLPPWFANIAKRQVKSPKVYIADTGLLHALLGVRDRHEMEGHPKVGASWEGFVIKEIATHLGARPEELFFWATHAGAELDLLMVRGHRRLGFEIKRTTSPTTSRSLHAARTSLGLDTVDLVHAGEHTFPLAEGVRAIAFRRLQEDIEPLG